MKKLTKELNQKTIKELEKQAFSIREEMGKMILSSKTAAVKDTNMLYKKRKQLAVILTLLSSKKEMEKVKAK